VTDRWPAILSTGLFSVISCFNQNAADRTAALRNSDAPVWHPTVSDKWQFFVQETFAIMTLAAGAFKAGLSQITNSDPRYGVGAGPYAERFGASTADIMTQNFFGDFVMASAFHEDTRYRRQGPAHGGIWKRTGYVVSRAFITRTDAGASSYNWSNLTGTTMSAGFSNLYYPPREPNGRRHGHSFRHQPGRRRVGESVYGILAGLPAHAGAPPLISGQPLRMLA